MEPVMVGKPNPVIAYQTLARLLGRQTGYEITLEKLTDKATGKVVWRKGDPIERRETAAV